MRKKFSMTPVVMVIALDGEVQLYAESLRYLAWKLTGAGAEILRFGCRGSLNACTSLNSTNKNQLALHGKSPVCMRCKSAQAGIRAEEIFEVLPEDLIENLSEAEFLADLRARLEEYQRIESILDMAYCGFEVVRIAFFDFAITAKQSHTSKLDDPAIRERFVLGVKDQLILLKALRRIHETKKITHVLYVNGNYSQNTLIRLFFGSYGVQCISVEPQLTSQNVLTKVLLAERRFELNPEWLLPITDAGHDKLLSEESIHDVLRNFGARIDGGDFNAYTSLSHDKSSIDELERINTFLRRYSRAHAFFLSSEDELTPHVLTHGALNGGNLGSLSGYKSQADFVHSFLQEAGQHPQIGFVIRLHPRMAANKREDFESEEHVKYKQMLADMKLPDNVIVLYGDSKISSYYIISKVDLVVVAWSTIGLEALLLGTPVISVFPSCLMYPLSAFSKQPQVKRELEAALFETTDFGVADDDLMLRWLAQGFEGQFFATAAPRSRGGTLGRVYRVCYRILSRFGLYRVAASVISLLPSARVRLDERRLMVKQETKRDAAKAFVKKSIQLYRKKYISALIAYGEVRN
jgi:hypothetical protein